MAVTHGLLHNLTKNVGFKNIVSSINRHALFPNCVILKAKECFIKGVSLFMEKRKTVRIKTHSAVKLVSSRGLKLIYGYLDNICEAGMGIVSPEQIIPGSRFTCGFFLGNNTDKINTIATMVHVTKGNDAINYYGFRFDYISVSDHRMISFFIEKAGLLANN
jgi:hypothetical protein